MKKILFSACMLAAISAQAQETYTNAEVVSEDLNGTARYVGMGGAMEALGADISTMGTNPAGIGLLRRSSVSMTAGLVSQQNAGKHTESESTKASFDQVGFVWNTNLGDGKSFNVGFNYKKNRNFNNILNVSAPLNGASQILNSYMNLMDAKNMQDQNLSQLDALYYNTFVGDKNGNLYYNVADGYSLSRAVKGYVGEYDINISGALSQRAYLGLTVGFHDVHYNSSTSYTESLLNSSNENVGNITVYDQRQITGSGFNVKLGGIFFPIEDSPFRFGLSIATPTWYDLDTRSVTALHNKTSITNNPINPNFTSEGSYAYKVYTPWKFGVSLGHTVAQYLALGLSYEYADYASISSRVIDGYDAYGQVSSYTDTNMNTHTKRSLKGVSTLKLGAEVKASPEVAVRVGYNLVTSMYRDEAFRDGTIWSPGTYYSSQTDYTNWKSTNRLTCGVGYAKGPFAFDVAYQYSTANGNFKPFMDSSATYEWDDNNDGVIDEVENVKNYSDAVKVSNKRHQLIATLTYKF